MKMKKIPTEDLFVYCALVVCCIVLPVLAWYFLSQNKESDTHEKDSR